MPKFNVRKSIVIQAPAEKVFATVRDFKQWQPWSPWFLAAPDCRLTYAADGRSYAWDGKIVGAGETGVITEEAPRSIKMRRVVQRPWKSVASVRFDFEETDAGIKVSWSMESTLPLFLFWMKPMMAAFTGMDYQRGLLMLKDHIEAGSVPSKVDFLGAASAPAFTYVGIKVLCPFDEISKHSRPAFERLFEWSKDAGIDPTAKPFSLYDKFDPVKSVMGFTAGIPVPKAPERLPPGFVSGDYPATKVYSVKHTGPYRHLGNMWAAGKAHERAKIFRQNNKIPPFETYENDPREVAENDLLTIVHFPMR